MSGTTGFAPNPARGSTADASGGLARIYDNIQIRLPGVAFPVVRAAVFDAAEQFCMRSCVWRTRVSWAMPAGADAVDLRQVDDMAVVVWVLRVEGLRSYRISPPAVLVDIGGAAEDRVGTALVVLKPQSLNDFELPTLLVDQWGMALRDGAMAQLHAQMGKPYSDPKLAMVHHLQFRRAIFLAKETVRTQGDFARPGFSYFANGAQRGRYSFGASVTAVLPSAPPSPPAAAGTTGGTF